MPIAVPFREATLPMPGEAALFSVASTIDRSPMPAGRPHVMVGLCDTGGSEAVLPVLRELHAHAIGTTVVAASHGRRILEEHRRAGGLQVSRPLDEWPAEALSPAALLLAPSVSGNVERDLLTRFPGVPAVVVEDYYESGREPIIFARERGQRLPTLCVLDDEAARLARRRYAGLEPPIAITGSPTFDALAGEDADAVRMHNRELLGVPADKKMVTFLIPHLGEASLRLAGQVAGAFRQMDDSYIFAPRRHPSDAMGWAVYKALLHGVPTLDTAGFSTDVVASAADVVVGHRSVAILREAVRQRPTITLTTEQDAAFTVPLLEAGTSVPAHPDELHARIAEVLDTKSARRQELDRNLQSLKPDGLAAARVAAVVCRATGMR